MCVRGWKWVKGAGRQEDVGGQGGGCVMTGRVCYLARRESEDD